MLAHDAWASARAFVADRSAEIATGIDGVSEANSPSGASSQATDGTGEQYASTPPPPAAYGPRPTAQIRDSRTKSPGRAAAFSLLPGLGQVYVGYYPRGFVHIVVVAGIISVLASTHGYTPCIPLLGFFLTFFGLYTMIDAARPASRYDRALSGGREPALPEGFERPGMGGSIFGGSVLIVAAFVVLLHARFGVRPDWLGDWRPVFPMLFGAWPVFKAVEDRNARPWAAPSAKRRDRFLFGVEGREDADQRGQLEQLAYAVPGAEEVHVAPPLPGPLRPRHELAQPRALDEPDLLEIEDDPDAPRSSRPSRVSPRPSRRCPCRSSGRAKPPRLRVNSPEISTIETPPWALTAIPMNVAPWRAGLVPRG